MVASFSFHERRNTFDVPTNPNHRKIPMSDTSTPTPTEEKKARKPRGPRVYPPIQEARNAVVLQDQLTAATEGYLTLPENSEGESIVERATRTGLEAEIKRLMKAIRKAGYEPEGGLSFPEDQEDAPAPTQEAASEPAPAA